MKQVQLNEDLTQVIAVLGCPQDPAIFPNQAEVEDDDERYLAFLEKLPRDPFAGASAPPPGV